MQKNNSERRTQIRTMVHTMVAVAVFCAVAYVCQFVFRIRVFGFLTFDAKDAIMAVGAMIFGPVWGLAMTLILATLEAISIGGTGYIGWIMDILSSASFVCVGAFVYRRRRTMSGAILGLSVSVISMTVVMLLCNLLLTPLYTGSSVGDIIKMIPTVLLPFNLTKAFLNAGLVLVLYKPISTALKRAKLVRGEVGAMHFDKKSALMLVTGLLVIAACITVFLLFMRGSFEWGNAS